LWQPALKEKKMKTARILTVIVCVMALVNFALAENIRGINIDFVTIGHAGNAADTGGTPGCGAVGYNYRIGKYDVTNAQWNTFVAVAGAPTGSDGSYSDSSYWTGTQVPTNRVSWYEAAQFCNYLTSGDKSKGAYQFSGSNASPGSFQSINRTAAKATYGTIYVIPTENEWYKAAYFKPDGSGYSLYANGTDTAPIAGVQSNYYNAIGTPWDVGTGTMEQNGTFDMMGNIDEWNETRCFDSDRRCLHGGSFVDIGYDISSYSRGSYYPQYELGIIGFRVASVPEPASALLIGAGFFFARLRRRQS
jgi:formylglycine-generating enzyme